MSSVDVLILKANKYNDENGRAAWYDAGDILTTEHGYADIIVAHGSASFDLPGAATAPVEEEIPEPVEALFTDVTGVTKRVNEGLLAAGATWEKINEMDVMSLTKVAGLGPKTAAKLKAQAEVEVERD